MVLATFFSVTAVFKMMWNLVLKKSAVAPMLALFVLDPRLVLRMKTVPFS